MNVCLRCSIKQLLLGYLRDPDYSASPVFFPFTSGRPAFPVSFSTYCRNIKEAEWQFVVSMKRQSVPPFPTVKRGVLWQVWMYHYCGVWAKTGGRYPKFSTTVALNQKATSSWTSLGNLQYFSHIKGLSTNFIFIKPNCDGIFLSPISLL